MFGFIQRIADNRRARILARQTGQQPTLQPVFQGPGEKVGGFFKKLGVGVLIFGIGAVTGVLIHANKDKLTTVVSSRGYGGSSL